jgi:glycosyl hydrolase family 15
LHAGVRIARVALLCLVIVAVGVLLVSGGSDSDPRTPPALPGLPPPFLGTAVSGDGSLTAAVDAYGDVVDLRAGPAGAALIDNPSDRQAAGTVPEETGIVPRVGGRPMWEADKVTQRYLPGTNVVRTVARFGSRRVVMTTAATGRTLGVTIRAPEDMTPSFTVDVASEVRCAHERRAALLDLTCGVGRAATPVPAAAAGHLIASAATEARRWLGRSRPLGREVAPRGPARPPSLDAAASRDAHRRLARPRPLGGDAPAWARSMYERSLLTIHALTSRATGAVAAGARDGWAYVWPRDAATAALALAASGHRAEARHVARFLTGLDLTAAARFTETGAPVPGRAAQGDALGWVTAAARATNVPAPHGPFPWRDRADYQESAPGTYLGNALAAAGSHVDGPKSPAIVDFSAHQHGGLVREEGDPGSGLDSAAGWAVRPFRLTALYPAAERTLLQLVRHGTPYGITPSENWSGGEDPWTAPTAWSAWALAALAAEPCRTDGRGTRTNLPAVREGGSPSRRFALELLSDLRRAATPAGDLPERVGVHSGIPTSTTPLLWSSAFTVLALRELWP